MGDVTHYNRRSILRAGGILGVAALAGCSGDGGDGSDGGDGGTTDGGSDSLSLKLGHINPLSGSVASVGRPQKRGVDLAADHINSNDDKFEIEIVHRDDEASEDKGIQRARELDSAENVDAIAGFSISSVALAVSEFAANENLVMNVSTAQTGRTRSTRSTRRCWSH